MMAEGETVRWECVHCGDVKFLPTKPFFVGCEENRYGHDYVARTAP